MATPKRPYIKRDTQYWDGRAVAKTLGAALGPSISNVPAIVQAPHMEAEAAFDEQPHFSAKAACGGGSSTVYRDGIGQNAAESDRFPNLRTGIVPFQVYDGGYYGASEAISLSYTAFYNYALLRNAITLLRNFSVGPIHVKTTNKTVKTFVETWLEAIGANQFMNQYFLEYYRSGNVFIYKFNGVITDDGLNMLKETYARAGETIAATTKTKVPIRYMILNPMQVFLQMGPLGGSEPQGWVRMLSTYEIQRLRNPQTIEDKQVLESFPKHVQDQIRKVGTVPYLFVPLDPTRLFTVFYDKMDYEPLAIPMAYPVLNDIEFKLELRRMDIALASTIERVILLVTAGRPADQFNQVPPKDNLGNLQTIFRNKTIGRVLVADYTTKAQWVIPDLKELLGPGKYEQVDKDIKEGLQYMFFGEEKFANAAIKTKIFIENLKEGRRAFLQDFLMPEVKKVCQAMGFRHVPVLEFEEIQMQDEALMARLYVQMAQLGLLTDDELNEALTTGMLPSKEESLKNQVEYRKERNKGHYEPLAPAKPEPGSGGTGSAGKGRPSGTGGTPAARKVTSPIGTRNVKASLESDVERHETYRFGMTKVAENLMSMNGLRAAVEGALAKKWKTKGGAAGLGHEERSVAASLAQSIVFNEPESEWLKAIPVYTKDPKDIPEAVAKELIDIRAAFDSPEDPVDSWMAGILVRSKVETPKA